MGNVRSVFLCREADVQWQEYVAEDWRSERTRDLDKLGGAACIMDVVWASIEEERERPCSQGLIDLQ